MKNLMDDRGISPLVATVILIAITVAAAGSIAVIITRLSPGSTGLAPTMDIDVLFKDNDTTTTTYNPGRAYRIADDNIVYVRITHVGGGRVYSPTTDLTVSFAFAYDNKEGGTIAVSGGIGFPARTISSTNCTVTSLLSSTSAEGYFETGNVWVLKIVPSLAATTGTNLRYGANENVTVIATVASGGKTPAASVTSSYWTITGTTLG